MLENRNRMIMCADCRVTSSSLLAVGADNSSESVDSLESLVVLANSVV